MSKTPEQLAEEYANWLINKTKTIRDVADSERPALQVGFLAGYQTAQQWISVKDRLPNIGDPCLVTCHEERYTIAEYDGIKWTTLNSIAYYHPIVTHWQWLPEIPKEEV
jgi:hypothetical protein